MLYYRYGWTAIDDVLLSGVESELFSASSEDLIWHTNSIDGWYLFCFDIVKLKTKILNCFFDYIPGPTQRLLIQLEAVHQATITHHGLIIVLPTTNNFCPMRRGVWYI